MHPSGVPQINNQESNSAEEENHRHDESEREATEMSPIRRPTDRDSIISLPDQRPWISRFWRSNIALSVPHDACRDHLANERTYLGYLRTSVMVSMTGIFVTQLFRIEQEPAPSDRIRYYDIGKPLGATFQAAAMVLSLLGFERYLRQQWSMARGKAWAGGWELLVIGLGVLLLILATLILVLGVGDFALP